MFNLETKKDYFYFALYHVAQAALVIVTFVGTGIATHHLIIVPKAKVQAVRELVAR